MNCIEGKILTDHGFKQGYILRKNREDPLLHFGRTTIHSTQKALIIPTFVNAHTHIGDTFIRKKEIPLPRDIKQLVAPPNGLKHELLKKTDSQTIINGIIHGLRELQNEGVSIFIDFRENGLKGIKILQNALQHVFLKSIILGRPDSINFHGKDINLILESSDGIGVSSIEDLPYERIVFAAEQAKKAGKRFAFHASERIREQIKPILDLDPDFIVHMTKASKNDLKQVKKQNIPIVVCPRSNHFFKMKANLKKMKEIGNTILLGTDNFMLHTPSILQEIRFIKNQFPGLFTIEELFMMATYSARKALNLKDYIPGSTLPMSWIIINPNTYQIITIIKKVEEG